MLKLTLLFVLSHVLDSNKHEFSFRIRLNKVFLTIQVL